MAEMGDLKKDISTFFRGEVVDDESSLTTYSHDASLFEVRPKLVVFPQNAYDIAALVKYVSEHKKSDPSLSFTARAAGSCMSGGSLNESIILDVTKHMGALKEISVDSNGANGAPIEGEATVEPGMFYRDFEVETLKRDVILPCYTASKNLCAIGGMVANNAAGEKTLQYGKMENYVRELKVVFADGVERVVKPLTRAELEAKFAAILSTPRNSPEHYEGTLYKNLFDLITGNQKEIMAAKPAVSKNSAGYFLWNVWDEHANNGEGCFDLTKLIVGSQGTLGIVTEAKLKLVPVKKISKLFVIFMPELSKLGDLVNEILPLKPESIESYDDSTMKLAVKFMPEMMRTMHAGNFFKLVFKFIPEVLMMLTGGVPKLVLLVEFSGNDEKEIDAQLAALHEKIKHFGFQMRATKSEAESEKFWTIRRESFNLLRKHVRGMRTAPFIDDVVVQPQYLPEFLPKMRKILDDNKLFYTIAGHAGNGNFHIIPLMDMKQEKNRALIRTVSDQIYDLVLSYKGSTNGEHNDGIVRTPYLEKMYGPRIVKLFEETKKIFDPQNIFNPGKKVGGTIEYMESHLVKG